MGSPMDEDGDDNGDRRRRSRREDKRNGDREGRRELKYDRRGDNDYEDKYDREYGRDRGRSERTRDSDEEENEEDEDQRRGKRGLEKDSKDGSPDRKRPVRVGLQGTIDITFRLLVPTSRVGFIIGKQGAHINTIREDTGAKIRIAPSAPGLDERIITVECRVDDVTEWSPAEEALMRIFKHTIHRL
eukprot:TRINITY_DN487_c0_g1_i9.p1 TRINITY_DN487_c0_g1~~TRINITY_DN487_c0_g1_i9.p1  ORF type:complete len:206 (+),score=27.55 TRINITY_DN487_c0_g1_i9:58-618(+)